MFSEYDIIVVGGGHAGCEAAAAAANMGSKTLLISMSLQNIATMSCNPAMGGIGKGQIIREIDALGGYSGIVADRSLIQFRMLNRSKGPAMWSPRTQNDRMLFSATWRELLEQTPNLDFYQDMVVDLIVSRETIKGVITQLGMEIMAKAVIITAGTFLNGTIHVGSRQIGGGRMGEAKSMGITERLVSLGFESDRLKTGTPPRIDGRSLDYSKMEIQNGDDEIVGFSYLPDTIPISAAQQRNCWISYTSQEVHEELKKGFSDSPMFQGRIQGTGPRYCPSIEDKINRFADKDKHQLFIEPEGWDTVETYINGFSTSLPQEIQYEALKKVPGFENAKFFRPGYAIEYDYFPPTQLRNTLETKLVAQLFFAGQINGTTGYEEAACQGLMAGINAHQKVAGLPTVVLARNQAYIGVLIDDLINKGTDEPYRMFTSRAEFRTTLRQDNADQRLTKLGFDLGLATKERFDIMVQKYNRVQELRKDLEITTVEVEEIADLLKELHSSPIKERQKLSKLLLRPEISIEMLLPYLGADYVQNKGLEKVEIEQAEIIIKYDTYIEKEKEMANRILDLESLTIPSSFDYSKLNALSMEARQKLAKIQPHTLGQASRISGVNPSDVQILLVHMGR